MRGNSFLKRDYGSCDVTQDVTSHNFRPALCHGVDMYRCLNGTGYGAAWVFADERERKRERRDIRKFGEV